MSALPRLATPRRRRESATTARRSHVRARFGTVLALAAGLALVAAVVAAGRSPHAPAVPPAAQLVVADLRGRALNVVDTADPTRTRRIPLEGGPHEMAQLPDGRIAVSLEQAGALAIVDVATGVTRTLTIGGLPHGLVLVGDTLYVTDRSANRLRRFDVRDWHEGASALAGGWPHALARLPSGSLAIANAADDTVSIAGRSVAVSHVPETIAVGRDGRVATAGSLGGAVELFSADGVPVARHEVGGRPVRVLFAPDGRTLAVALSAEGSVAFIDGDRVRRVEVGGVPDGLVFSGDGRWLYVGDDAGGVVTVIDVQRGTVLTRLAVGESAGAILEVGAPVTPRG